MFTKNHVFSGPPLDINSYLNFAKYSDIEFSLYGYFNYDEIVAFSSEFCNEKKFILVLYWT